MDKKELRAKLKTLRSQIIASDQAERVRNNFLKNISVSPASIIATYIPTQSELNIDKLNRALGYIGCKLCLPCLDVSGLVFREWGIYTELTPNKFGILEPNQKSKIKNPEIIIVPTLGFNPAKFRIGYGGGYYDRTFVSSKALKVGVAFAAQLVTENFQEAHDIPLDLIITEESVYK